jgi:hypothetical protein
VQQRLRIAGSNGQEIFNPEALVAIHRYANGIPRVVNLLCEHCLVSAFVDQQKLIGPAVVDGVARDFDLDNSTTPVPVPQSVAANTDGKPDLIETLRTLAKLADRLGDEEKNEIPGERKS